MGLGYTSLRFLELSIAVEHAPGLPPLDAGVAGGRVHCGDLADPFLASTGRAVTERQTVLVTGAAGHVVELEVVHRLATRGHDVVALVHDRMEISPTTAAAFGTCPCCAATSGERRSVWTRKSWRALPTGSG